MKAKIIHQKRQAIAGKNVLGIDPGKRKHTAWVFNGKGEPLGKEFHFRASHRGYNEVVPSQLGRRVPNFSPENLVIAVETSCNLWITVAHHFYSRGYQVLQVSPLTTKQSRAVVDHDYSQSDPKDAFLVTDNAQKGHYDVFQVLDDDMEAAHHLSITYQKLWKDRARAVGRLRSFVERVFPEYLESLRIDTKTSLELLKRHFLPEHFASLDIKAEEKAIRAVSRGQCKPNKLTRLREAAETSIGVPTPGQEDVYRISLDAWLAELHLIDEHLDRVERALVERARKDPTFWILVSIPGVSENLAGRFIAETRGPRRFEHYKQIEKLAGLNLRLRESGDRKGARRISGIGNVRLRCIIYQMLHGSTKAVPQVRGRFLRRQLENPCYRKNLVAGTSQLLRLIVRLIKEDRAYEERTQLQTDVKRLEDQYQRKNRRRKRTTRRTAA
jgi:transposase